jgi:raffinose/stachyose/melibiose transport system permease protein
VARKLSNPKPYVFFLFLGPIIIIFFLNAILPVFISFYYSFFNWTGGRTKQFVGLANYITLGKDLEFWKGAYNNLVIVMICTIGQVGLALVISFLLISDRLKFKEFHRTVIFFPVTVSALVIGFIWSIMYNKDYGLVNFLLRFLHLERFILPWLDNPDYILITVSIPVVLQYIGLWMIMFMGAIKGIPSEILECASLDGCNDIQKSLRITLPMIYSTFKVTIMLCVSGTMKIFDHILVLTKGGPGKSSQVLALYSYSVSFDRLRISYGSTISIGLLVLSLVLVLSSRKLLGGKRYE